MNGEHESNEIHPNQIHEVDVDIVQTEGSGRPKWLLGLLGLVAAGALIGGVAALSNGDDSEVDVAAIDEESGTTEDAEEDVVEEPAPTTTAAPEDEITVATTIGPVDFATDAVADYGFGGPGNVVFDGEQFITVGYSDSGSTLRTSTDGIDWDERQITGLTDGYVSLLAEHDGTVVAILEQWEADGEESSFFGPAGGPSYSMAVSTDLENWTTSELSVSAEDGYSTSVSGLALSESGVVILAQSYPDGPDEMRILFEAGILTEDDLDRYCGLEFSDEAIIVNSCNYDDYEEPADIDMEEFEQRYSEAESDEERQALEEEFDQLMGPDMEPIVTILPTDPLFAELDGIYDYEYDESQTTTVLAGPLDSQLALATLPGPGHTQGVVAVDGSFVVVLSDYTESGPTSKVFTSPNGLVWTEAGPVPDGVSGQLNVLGDDTLLLAGINERTGEPVMVRSGDRGASWEAVDLPVDLYGAYPMVVTGPAGAAVFITGSLEEVPGYGPQGPIVVTKDGYSLTLPDLPGGGGATLAGPDGEIIHTFTDEDLQSADGNIEGVVRENPLTGMPTFLDPDTGEDLVSFTDRDFEEAYGVFDEVYEEPEMTTAVLFSTDGLTWTSIEDDRLTVNNRNGGVNPLAIGDDELIVASYTWNAPPEELFAFEMEGREPTEEEIEALDTWEMTNNGGDSTEFFRIDLG